jgi:hypothetical protein
VAKTDKEKKVAERLGLAERDFCVIRCHPDGVFVWKNRFFSYYDAIPLGLAM